MEQKKRGLSLGTKLTGVYALFIIIVAGVLSVSLYIQLRTEQHNAMRRRVRDIVNLVVPQIDGTFHSYIMVPDDIRSSYYRIISETLEKTQAASDDIAHIYTLRQKEDGTIVLVVDLPNESGIRRPVGEKPRVVPLLLQNSIDRLDQTLIEGQPSEDAFGEMVMRGYGPIYDSNGRLDGVLVVELDASMILANRKWARNEALITFFIILPIVLTLGLWVVQRMIAPIEELVHGAEYITRGQLHHIVEVHSQDELGRLARAFNTMAESLQKQMATEQQAMDDLRESNEQMRKLLDIIRELETPVIPIKDRALLVPLVGYLDKDRAENINQTVLDAVYQRRAKIVILDVTGISQVDTAVAHHIEQLALGIRLLGGKTIISGMRAEVAQTVVALGVHLDDVQVMSQLEHAIRQVFGRTI